MEIYPGMLGECTLTDSGLDRLFTWLLVGTRSSGTGLQFSFVGSD